MWGTAALNHLPLQNGRCGPQAPSTDPRSRSQRLREPVLSQAHLRAGPVAASRPVGQPRCRPATLRPLAAIAAFSSACHALAAPAPCTEDGVAPELQGLAASQLDLAFRAEHPGLLEALAGAAAELSPATSARTLRRLGAELPPALTAVATRCKQALKAAFDGGAGMTQELAVDLYASCARSSPWLWLTPYFGHRCACAVDDFVTQGWATGELAVGFAEAYATLVGRGRLHQVEAKWMRVARAAMKHPLSLAHTTRLLAAAGQLPVEMRIQLSLHARSTPSADWHAQLCAMHAVRQEEEAQARSLRLRGRPAPAAGQEPCSTERTAGQLLPAHSLHAAQLSRR